MSTQPSLFVGAPRIRAKPERASLDSFQRFHRKYPQVYEVLVQQARNIKLRGTKKYSIKTLWEVLRWTIDIGGRRIGGDFKLNNNHHAYYARLIMQQESDLKGFFELRERKKH